MRNGKKQLVAMVLALALTGCAQTKSWIDKVSPAGESTERASGDAAMLGAPAADDYLRELDRLATGDPATQIEIYLDAESRSTLTPDPSTDDTRLSAQPLSSRLPRRRAPMPQTRKCMTIPPRDSAVWPLEPLQHPTSNIFRTTPYRVAGSQKPDKSRDQLTQILTRLYSIS